MSKKPTAAEKQELISKVMDKIVYDIVHENFTDLLNLFEVTPDQALQNYVDGKSQTTNNQ
jgi:hypothetical protein